MIYFPVFLIKFHLVHVLGVHLGVPGICVDGWHTDVEKSTCDCCLEKWLFNLLRARQTFVLLPKGFEIHI